MSAFGNGSGGMGATKGTPDTDASTNTSNVWSTDDPNKTPYKFQLPMGGDTTNTGITGMTTIPGYGSQGTQVVPTMGGLTFGQSDAGPISNMTDIGIPQSNKTNWGSIMAAGSKLKMPDQGGEGLTKTAGRAGVTLPAKTFGAPVVALPTKAGSTSGQNLLAFMQKYRPGVEK